jgi:hypothetical protein
VYGVVYEPCVGDGAIARWLADKYGYKYKRLYTNDLDKKRPADWHLDARSTRSWDMLKAIDWTITNPPFAHINRIMELGTRHSTNFITLARLSVLEPTSGFRRDFYAKNGKPRLLVVLPRYQFTKPSKDTMTCCWIGWGPDVPEYWDIETQEPPK